ncbi:MAG: glycosyltransferase [Alphaproteobacteria bacterium]|nr:glycosyltransferase [Alphaproteobacteria bacterium]
MTYVDNIVFFSYPIDIRAGGPAGYIANLQKGLNKIDAKNIAFINASNTSFVRVKVVKFLASIFSFCIPIRSVRSWVRNNIRLLLNLGHTTQWHINNTYFKKLRRYKFKTITCHCTPDALLIRDFLNKYNIKAKLMLMSHSPQPPSEEIYERALANQESDALEQLKYWQEIEKRAFETADIYIFPSKEALTCYTDKMKYLPDLIQKKRIVYIRTGCEQLKSDATKLEIRKKYNINTKFVICYIGRHNSIKGYDKLQEIASCILKQRKDVSFLIGGAFGPIQPLKHERWIEIGRCNPAEVLKAADLFVLPNKQTYFDLILLEVLSTGTPCLASGTGGNITVYNDTGALQLYDSVNDCVNNINMFLDSDINIKQDMCRKAYNAYLNNYTLEKFANNYIKIIDRIEK